jgi:hypothetical protein
MRKGIFVAVAALLAVSALAQGANVTVFADNFDSYANDAAFKAVWNGATGAVPTLDVGYGKNGTNGVYVQGGAVVQKNFAAQTISDAKPIVVEFDYWDEITGAADRNTLGIRSSGIFYEFGEMNTLDDGSNWPANGVSKQGYGMRIVYGGAPVGVVGSTWWAATTTKLTSTGADGWHHFKATIKGTSTVLQVTLGNGNVYTRSLTTTTAAGKTLDNVRMGGPSGISSSGYSDFDNVNIYTTPEPASMLLLGLGGLLLRRRRA